LAAGVQKWITDLNHLYRDEPALWAGDFTEPGFFWVDCADRDNSVLSFVRQTPDCARQALVLLNLAPASWETYRIGLPKPGHWREVLNSDSAHYGGDDHGNSGGVDAQDLPWHNQPWSAEFALPPLSCLLFLHSC
jgi:1,4-alpha-glucan branching enzyme